MKVLHLYKSYLPETVGGVEQVIFQIISGTTLLGVKSEVLSLSSKVVERTIKFESHTVHRCRADIEIASTPFSLSAFFRFYQLAKKADVIHYHFPYPFADLLHFLLRIKKPTVVTYHSDIVKQKYLLKLYKPLMNRFLKSVDCIIATSPNYLKSSNTLSQFKEKVEVIPIGINKSTYPKENLDRVNFWKERLGGKFFLFIGVMRYYKGLHILIEAASKSAYPVVIVGSGPIEKELKKQALINKADNIHFVGFVSDIDKVALLSLGYAVLFPSHLRSEAFGVTLLEGAMYYKPLISSEIGTGTSYINVNGSTGIIIQPGSADSLREAMDYLWNNPKIAAEMGKNAGERYERLFTADIMARSYYDVYRKLSEY